MMTTRKVALLIGWPRFGPTTGLKLRQAGKRGPGGSANGPYANTAPQRIIFLRPVLTSSVVGIRIAVKHLRFMGRRSQTASPDSSTLELLSHAQLIDKGSLVGALCARSNWLKQFPRGRGAIACLRGANAGGDRELRSARTLGLRYRCVWRRFHSWLEVKALVNPPIDCIADFLLPSRE